MTTTLKIILLLAGSLWGLACVVFVVAMAAAAGRQTPEYKSTRHAKSQMRNGAVKETETAVHAHTA